MLPDEAEEFDSLSKLEHIKIYKQFDPARFITYFILL